MKKEDLKDKILKELDFEKAKIEPYYQDIKNEIIQPDNVTVTTKYFWTKWAPVLGPVATSVILRLRQYCYYNRLTGEKRDYCWPSQSTLAKEIGVNNRKTVVKAIRLLEKYGFVRREPNYRYDPVKKKKVRSTDTYYISMDDPLTEEDKKELVVRTAERIVENKRKDLENQEDLPMSKKRTQVAKAVDNLRPMSKKWTYKAVQKTDRKKYLEDILNNVKTLDRKNPFKEENEYLVGMLAEKLGKGEENERFYRLICYNLPGHIIMKALAAVEDKYLNSLDPSKEGFRVNKPAYFTGVLRNIAKEENIDF
jgi:DNA-binding transcriptional regulator YhcF (GntR family)